MSAGASRPLWLGVGSPVASQPTVRTCHGGSLRLPVQGMHVGSITVPAASAAASEAIRQRSLSPQQSNRVVQRRPVAGSTVGWSALVSPRLAPRAAAPWPLSPPPPVQQVSGSDAEPAAFASAQPSDDFSVLGAQQVGSLNLSAVSTYADDSHIRLPFTQQASGVCRRSSAPAAPVLPTNSAVLTPRRMRPVTMVGSCTIPIGGSLAAPIAEAGLRPGAQPHLQGHTGPKLVWEKVAVTQVYNVLRVMN